MMFAASISNRVSEVEEIIMNFLIGVCKYNVQNTKELKSEEASCGVFAFFPSSTPGKTHYYVLSASSSNFGRCPAPGKVLPLKNIRLLVCVFSCF
jgi:hypothetical protein